MLRPSRDVPLRITSQASSSERRITPSWTVTQLKVKLEPITGIAPSSQKLVLKRSGQADLVIEAPDEDAVQVGTFPLSDDAEIHVSSLTPSANVVPFPTDPSAVPKYTMPSEMYSALPDTVRAYKKAHQIGRFDPHATDIHHAKVRRAWEEIERRHIAVDTRCRIDGSDTRRGKIAFVGEVPEIPTPGPWVGVMLDEPTGKNDGTVGEKRYFQCTPGSGLFVKPDRVEVGDFPCRDLDDELDGDMEEM